MPSLDERVRSLEQRLLSGNALSDYHDLPFAILQYQPEEEFEARHQIRLLRHRLEIAGKTVLELSLTEALWRCVSQAEGLEDLFVAESMAGIVRSIETVNSLLEQKENFVSAVVEGFSGKDPATTVGLLTDTAGLFPFFRSSAILNRLHGRVQVPTILFYPGVLEGTVGLSFMGVYDPDPSYRPTIF
jgi:hypothetical protein